MCLILIVIDYETDILLTLTLTMANHSFHIDIVINVDIDIDILLTLTLKMNVIVIGLRGQLKQIITQPETDAVIFNLLPLKLFLFLTVTLFWDLPLFCHCHRHCHHEVILPDLERAPSSQICRHCTPSSSSPQTRHTLHLSSGCQPSWQPTSYSFVCFFLFSCFYVTLVSSSPVVPRCHFIDRTCRRWRLPARPGSSSYYSKRHRQRRTGTEDRRWLGQEEPARMDVVGSARGSVVFAICSNRFLNCSTPPLLQKLTRRWISNCNSLQSEGKLKLCKRSRWSQMFQQSSRLFETLSSGLVGRLWGLLWVRLHEVWKWNYMKTDVLLWSQSLTPHDPWTLDVPGTQINDHYT